MTDLGGGWQKEAESRAYEAYDLALTGATRSGERAKSGVCRTEIVESILNANLLPRPMDLSNAAEIPCPEIVAMFKRKMSDENFVSGVEIFAEKISSRLSSGNMRMQEEEVRWQETFSILGSTSNDSLNWKILQVQKNGPSSISANERLDYGKKQN